MRVSNLTSRLLEAEGGQGEKVTEVVSQMHLDPEIYFNVIMLMDKKTNKKPKKQ